MTRTMDRELDRAVAAEPDRPSSTLRAADWSTPASSVAVVGVVVPPDEDARFDGGDVADWHL